MILNMQRPEQAQVFSFTGSAQDLMPMQLLPAIYYN